MLGDETAMGAGLRGILGIDQLNQNTSNFGFITDKLPKLAKSPRVVAAPLAMLNRDPVSDTLEVFKSNQAMGVFSLRHQPLTNYVKIGRAHV